MIITRSDSDVNLGYSYLNNYPDPFKSEEEKLTNESYIKNTLDYFANMAYTQYKTNKETFVKNYDLMKGIITSSDFYQDAEPEVKDFLETLTQKEDLPAYVKHYPIINPPVNTMVGELSKRPDIHKVKAFDEDSQNEELQYKTEIVQQLILQQARQTIINKLAIQGQDASQISDEDMQGLVMEDVKDLLTDYTSLAERWGNHTLTALKAQFNTKEKSEDAFRDLLICSREFYHIYEDNSKLGFNIKTENPKNVWQRGTPDNKYTSGVSGEPNVPYAIGTVYVKEISEIIEEFPELTEEEIKHLQKSMQNSIFMDGRESNLFKNETGINTIQYDTYNRLIYQERMILQSELGNEFRDDLNHWLGSNNAFSFGYKYVVIRAYWNSKKKVGELVYMDEAGDEQTRLVDESYKEGSPGEISINWGWVNQWYQGVKIGPDIYFIKPYTLLEYAPIIGLIHEVKNTTPRSLVDLMKPYQTLYNICMNQLFEILEKEIGNVASVNIRRIPRPKDGDANDAIDVWEEEARKRGIIFDDDSPENTKGAMQNTTVARNVDLTRTAEIQSRYTLAVQLKQECWELIGMNRQRLGSPLATETATANQNALVQSFAQTEPYFAAHSYVLNQLYQAILDCAQYIESRKPTSTVNFISSQGESAFVQVTGDDIKLKDLKVFVTSKAEDQQLFNEFRQLSQAMLQNGASIYEVSALYATNSIREMQKVFKDLKNKQDQMQQAAQENEQAQTQGEQQIAQATLEQNERHHQDNIKMQKYTVDVKANTELAKAEISTFFQAPSTDADGDGTPDIMEIAGHQLKLQDAIAKRDLENKKLNLDMMQFQADQKNKKVEFDQNMEKMKIDREKIKASKQKAKAKPKK
jgi:hypothetical protein